VNGGEVWLATIAIAVVVIALGQVALVIVAARALREATATLVEVRRDLQPVVERAQRISDDAARVVALAASQMERIDGMIASAAGRLDHTLGVVQGAVVEPLRQGAAVVAAFRAALAVFRSLGDRQRALRDEEEALFVG
jgi:hypothetical protein